MSGQAKEGSPAARSTGGTPLEQQQQPKEEPQAGDLEQQQQHDAPPPPEQQPPLPPQRQQQISPPPQPADAAPRVTAGQKAQQAGEQEQPNGDESHSTQLALHVTTRATGGLTDGSSQQLEQDAVQEKQAQQLQSPAGAQNGRSEPSCRVPHCTEPLRQIYSQVRGAWEAGRRFPGNLRATSTDRLLAGKPARPASIHSWLINCRLIDCLTA